jgi:hypothetical protein
VQASWPAGSANTAGDPAARRQQPRVRHWDIGSPVVLGDRASRSPCGGSRADSSRGLRPGRFTTFPGEVIPAPHSWVEKVYPTLGYFHETTRGGHFAAWEEPELFATEIRAAFRPLR